MGKTLKVILGVAALIPALSMADASNFNYLEGGYLTGETGSLDVHGWGVVSSVQLNERFFAQVTYSDVNLNETIPDFRFDSQAHSFGAGFVFGQNATASVYGTASYVQINDSMRFDLDRFGDRYDGYDLGLGVRLNLTPVAELRLAVNHTDLGSDAGSSTVPSVALVYKFTPRIAGVANYALNSSDDMLALGFRFYF